MEKFSDKLNEANNIYRDKIELAQLKPNTRMEDIRQKCEIAKEQNYKSIITLPEFVTYAKSFLENTNIKITSIVSFPKGNESPDSKIKSVSQSITDGADEVDVVFNVPKFKKVQDGALDFFVNELNSISEICHKNGVHFGVVVETCALDIDTLTRVCTLCKECGVDVIMTSTGVYTPANSLGEKLKKVELMRKILPDYIEIKVSGGIRSGEHIALFRNVADRYVTSVVI